MYGRLTPDDQLLLHVPKVIAIVPAPLLSTESAQEPVDVIPVLNGWARRALLGIAGGLVLVFALSAWLDPYDAEGQPRRLETHTQLGLPPCTFYQMTGVPCPSCGLTTSFALLLHGDLGNSLRANAAGTLLALFWLGLIPWSLASAWGRRPFFIVSIERALLRTVLIFVVLLLTRWAIVIGLAGWQKLLGA